MLQTLSIIFPVFALILAGFLARKTNVLGENSARELSRFVVWLALPALLFEIMAKSDFQAMLQWDFIAAYTLGSFGIFFAVLAWRLQQKQALADASVESVAASYSNTGYLGFPLMLLLFGSVSEVPTAIASVIVVSILFGFAIVLIESALHANVPWQKRSVNVVRSVFKNPLVFAPLAGMLFAASDWQIPLAINHFLEILGGAASPAALVSLGLFLADAWGDKETHAPPIRSASIKLTVVKLVVQPILVAWLALWVFDMELQLALMAIVLAALPTGTGPYMLAEFYQRNALVTAQTILFSTVFSVITLSLLLHFIQLA